MPMNFKFKIHLLIQGMAEEEKCLDFNSPYLQRWRKRSIASWRKFKVEFNSLSHRQSTETHSKQDLNILVIIVDLFYLLYLYYFQNIYNIFNILYLYYLDKQLFFLSIYIFYIENNTLPLQFDCSLDRKCKTMNFFLTYTTTSLLCQLGLLLL